MRCASTTGTQFWSENLDYRSGILACFDTTRESVEVISLVQTPLRVVNWRGISAPVSNPTELHLADLHLAELSDGGVQILFEVFQIFNAD
jgi:hypothetical protein